MGNLGVKQNKRQIAPDPVGQHHKSISITGLTSIISLVVTLGTLCFFWGKYAAVRERLDEMTSRNEQYELSNIVETVVERELAKQTVVVGTSTPRESGRSPGGRAGESVQPRPRPLQPISVSLRFESPQEGQTFGAGTVIEARGRHTFTPDTLIWLVLSDAFGNLYLQNPPVRLLVNGSWTGRNVNLGQGVTEIHAVRVTEEGDKEFQTKVLRLEWAAFNRLPSGSRIVATRKIKVLP